MLLIFLLALTASPLVTGSSIPINERPKSSPIGIVGGKNASIIDYPYQVAIFKDNDYTCGGSIVNEKFVLTAAHCFYGAFSNATVRAGSSFKDSDGQYIDVKKVNNHPNYRIINNDISLLELSSPLVFGEGVAPIQLPTNETVFKDNDISNATGWGITVDDGTFADVLQVVSLPLYNSDTCLAKYGNVLITDDMLCAGGDGQDVCSGDSGGPLVVDGVQIGIVSAGTPLCNGASPAIYTKVSHYLEFIEEIVNGN